MENPLTIQEEKNAPRVGVVDDDESMREALEGWLESLGFSSAVFSSAGEFLNADEYCAFDCLILDVRMPGMNGLELQRKLIAENCAVPIVFISALSEGDEKEQALARGAVDFLYKPFSEDSLLGALSAAIRQGMNEKKKDKGFVNGDQNIEN